MGWQAREIPDQAGRVVVVTGASGGLGSVVTRELARCRARVIMAVRDPAKGERVRCSIMAHVPGASLEVRYLELSSLAVIRDFAEGVMRDTA
jgi:NAD(P)-dependent dehydrogenase (short-subunit alcohol dehydrogenase family)